MSPDVLFEGKRIDDVEILWDEPLSKHTSLRIGGRVSFFARPRTPAALPPLLEALWSRGEPFRVLAGGTNLLVEDGDLDFGVLCLARCGGSARWSGRTVEVDADVPLPRLSAEASRRGLSGLEGLEGVPGTVGGGLVMNAGAWGQDLSGVVTAVAVISHGRGPEWVPAARCGFRYRGSDLRRLGVASTCRMELEPRDPEAVRARARWARDRRAAAQPGGCATAGSVFKNPPGDHAGRILESLGFKGKRKGGAGFSELHANFLVNRGEATFWEAFGLCEEARKAAARAGTPLEYEIHIWRRFEAEGTGP